jgi:hypothetical protein
MWQPQFCAPLRYITLSDTHLHLHAPLYHKDKRERNLGTFREKSRAIWANRHHSPPHSTCLPNTSTISAALSRPRRQSFRPRPLRAHTPTQSALHARTDTTLSGKLTHSGCYGRTTAPAPASKHYCHPHSAVVCSAPHHLHDQQRLLLWNRFAFVM